MTFDYIVTVTVPDGRVEEGGGADKVRSAVAYDLECAEISERICKERPDITVKAAKPCFLYGGSVAYLPELAL